MDRRYSAINTARSALSSALPIRNGKTFGKDQVVIDFMKGVFNLRPPKPRYTEIWDPDKVLCTLKEWSPSSKLPLYKLSQKTALLFLLATGIRGHTLLGVRIDQMQITENSFIFHIERSFYKQNRQGWNPEPVVIKKLKENSEICPSRILTTYIERTENFRGNHKSLFIPLRGDKVSMLTHIYPHKPWRNIEVTICKITRLTAHFMCGLMSDLLICTCL